MPETLKKLRLSKSEKRIQPPHQDRLLKEIHESAVRSLTEPDIRVPYTHSAVMARTAFSMGVQFHPTQEWIDKFAEIGFGFYDASTPEWPVNFEIAWAGVDQPAPETEEDYAAAWEPKNGERIQCSHPSPPRSEADWIECWYIGKDRDEHVVRLREYSELISVKYVRPEPAVVEVDLGELFEVYAQAKGVDVHLLKIKDHLAAKL
jgi:hypothetical protein